MTKKLHVGYICTYNKRLGVTPRPVLCTYLMLTFIHLCISLKNPLIGNFGIVGTSCKMLDFKRKICTIEIKCKKLVIQNVEIRIS